ncbi:Hypothetical_protein [Hexamita inflata]|uniref:Hypothetical_protein n=1 Tax=Hexamita inflata TaxID=28002 RepID=A0AA86P4C2_9EUKA|nr:Hypothetical protein HINF_LOCUS19662 [Hexamita inflata]
MVTQFLIKTQLLKNSVSKVKKLSFSMTCVYHSLQSKRNLDMLTMLTLSSNSNKQSRLHHLHFNSSCAQHMTLMPVKHRSTSHSIECTTRQLYGQVTTISLSFRSMTFLTQSRLQFQGSQSQPSALSQIAIHTQSYQYLTNIFVILIKLTSRNCNQTTNGFKRKPSSSLLYRSLRKISYQMGYISLSPKITYLSMT